MRNTLDIADLEEKMPEAHAELMEILRTLEEHYKDMQDTEFTIEEGSLFMLQTRNAKRPAQAAVRFACDAVEEELLTREEALATIDPNSLDALLHPTFDPKADFEVLATGVSASPGAAKGEIVFTAADAVQAAEDGRDVILVRPFTEADDVAGFHAAKGILTSEGGKASHAALVARGMGRPAVVGADALTIDLKAEGRPGGRHRGRRGRPDRHRRHEGLGDARGRPARRPRDQRQLRAGARVGRRDPPARACARTPTRPTSARKAREQGAEGIGLCRTEHMFQAEDRVPKMQAMIMADDEDARRSALADLLPLQQEDFEGLFEAMAGLPVTIRLLDPPLHEFLPNLPDLRADVERARIEETDDLEELERMLSRVEEIHEENPMLGTRGCRLGILQPEIYEMQVEAIMRATKAVRDRDESIDAPHVEIMIPLVAYEQELEILRALVVRIGDEQDMTRGGGLHGRHDDRAAAGVLRRRPDRRALRLLLVRHQRPHADGAGLLARRRRVEVRADLHEAQDHRPLAVRDDRQARRRLAGAARRLGGARGQARAQARHLRRARRRPGVDPLLPHGRPGLRVLLAVPCRDRPGRGGGKRRSHILRDESAQRPWPAPPGP